LPAGSEVRIQEVATRIRECFQIEEVLVITEDGLPLSTSMPSTEADAWGGIGPRLFRKYDQETALLPMGKPRHCLLTLSNRCITMWHEPGIYLILSHQPSSISTEFQERSAMLAREIARCCQPQAAATS
jgi:hypothetical protein